MALRSYAGTVRAPDFPQGLDWLNVARPLHIADLRGRLAIIDFWTFCCINCMHMFPQLRRIEHKYGDRVIVVGVHSPKFPAERETANLREAVVRDRIEHPVVNDRDFAVWQRFGGRAWPTLMFIDPEGRVIGKHEGELPFEQFDPLVAGMLKEFEERGLLHAPASTIALEEIREPARTLSFPGKVLATKDGLFVADSNHHRIVFTGFDGSIRRTYGSGEPGFADGPDERAAFQQP